MFWADRIAKEIQEKKGDAIKDGASLLIRDEKTLSGRVHIGSMRGLAIHSLVSEILKEYGINNRFLWEHNDFDPFDSVQPYLDAEKFTPHLGKPLYLVPSPEPGFANFAEYFGHEFVKVHEKFGANPEYYWAYKDLYAAGKMDPFIRKALERADDVRRILKEVSGSTKEESWLPISIVCENCSKMMTTRAYDFDGDTVAYVCERSPDGCVPCGHSSRRSPFSGGGKLFWKADWAAKWAALGVDVEGGGKDHSTKGGARDVANHIAREVFGIDSPFDIPYEFFLVGGRKMKTSKGTGAMASEMAELFPPELLRLVLLGKEYNQQIDVDPEGESVPRMYDWYDELAQKVRDGVSDDFTRLYALVQLPENQAEISAPWQMRFSLVSFIVQMPHMNLEQEAAIAKATALTDEELTALRIRADYARFWLTTYAPDSYRYELQETLPEDTNLTDVQKTALTLLHDYLVTGPKTGEELHARLHELKTEAPIEPRELFGAIYKIFLNRTSGPKAGWFLSSLPHEFAIQRLNEVVM